MVASFRGEHFERFRRLPAADLVISWMLSERLRAPNRRQIVQKAQEQHEQLDRYDFATRYDSARRELLEVAVADQNGKPGALMAAAR